MKVKIIHLKRYPKKGSEGEILAQMELNEGQGIAGNYHQGSGRQVSILTQQAATWMAQQKEKGLCFHKFKENILIAGCLDNVSHLSVGGATLRLSNEKKYCFEECCHFSEANICPLIEGTAFADIVQSGVVKADDEIYTVASRYTRNIRALSAKEVVTLHMKKVCIIGSGGLGGYIVEILSRIGVLNITLVDYDVFEPNNLNRQLFSSESYLGSSKVEVAIQRITDVNSQVKITGINEKFESSNAEDILTGHDIVIDALDNIQTRLLLAKTCKKLAIPMVHGSIAGWYGQVCTIFPEDNTIEKLYKNAKQEKGGEVDLGNLPFTASTVASLQCAECIKVLTGKGEVIRNAVLHVDLLSSEYHKIEL